MKKITIFLSALMLARACFAQDLFTPASEKLDELMHAYARLNRFNGSILVAKGDSIIYRKAFGVRDADKGYPNEINTLFRIYSVTKTFTSTVIFRLIEEGRLSLKDQLSKFYPSFPKADSITIEQLLSHTSGIYDYTQGNDMKDETETSFMNFLSSKPLNFVPGKGWDYSNSGYWILGFIIRKVTGISYEEAVKKYVFLPCGMKDSGFDFKVLQHDNKATGYTVFSDGRKVPSVDIDPPGPYAAGAIYSTVDDLYRYAKALLSFRLIGEESLKQAWAPDSLNKHYGLGWQLSEIGNKRTVYHGGGGPGFRSNFLLIPEDSLYVIQLTNNENTNLDILSRSVCELYYGKMVKVPFSVPVDTFKLKRYIGYYSFEPGLLLQILMQDGQLVAKPVGQPETMLLAEKENSFYSLEAGAYLEFPAGKTGKWNEVVLRGNRELRGYRYTPSWGILGSATKVGWDGAKDIVLTRKSRARNVWEIKGIHLRTGVFKFRFNNDWSLNYGKKEGDNVAELNGKDISVQEGVYNIQLDLSEPRKPVYRLLKIR